MKREFFFFFFLIMCTIYLCFVVAQCHASIYLHHLLFFYVSLLPIVCGRKEREKVVVEIV